MGKYGRNGGGGRNDVAKARTAGSRVNKPGYGSGLSDGKKVLAKFDARLKLLEKEDALGVARSFGQANSGRFVRDARELLNRKQKKAKKAEMRKEIAAYDQIDDDEQAEEDEEEEQLVRGPQRNGKKPGPVVIVTGLGNIRKRGDKLEVVQSNKRNSQFLKEHVVLSNGLNTIVTVDNDLARKSRHKNGRHDEDADDGDHRGSSSLKNLAPLKIRVENELARRNPDRRSNSPPYQRMYSDTFYSGGGEGHRHHEPAPYERAPPVSRPPPASIIAYPPSSSNDHLNGRLHYSYVPAGGGHYGHEGRPVRRLSPPEYRFQPPPPPPPQVQSYHTSHHDHDGMDYEDSYHHTSEPVRAPPPPPQVVKSSLSSRSRPGINENGYRVVVSNLHPNVTQEDILELFSDIGPIKRAKFVEKGVAEVIYVNLDDAYSAIKKYDQKELDGRAMRIELTSHNAPVKSAQVESSRDPSPEKPITKFTTNNTPAPKPASMASNTLSNRFKAYPTNASVEKITLPEPSRLKSRTPIKVNQVDASIIQQVLFNKKPPANSNPVTFTVKL